MDYTCRRNTIEDAQILLVCKVAGYASTWRACTHDPGKSIKPIGKYQKARSLAPRITSTKSLPVIPLLDQRLPDSQVNMCTLVITLHYRHKKV